MEAWEYWEVTLEIVVRKLIIRILSISVDGRNPAPVKMHETLAKIGDSP